MKIGETFGLAIKNILSSKVRAILTMLGIIIGVAAVIVITGLGNGMETYMTDSFASMGTDLLTVSVSGRGSSRSVDVDDMYQLVDDNPDVFEAVSPTVSVSGTVKVGTDELDSTTVTGVGEDYDDMSHLTMADGRFINYADIDFRHSVAVIGNYINEEYYDGDAVGQDIRINGNLFTIVGVIDEQDDSTEGSDDDVIYMSYTKAQKFSWTGTISNYSFQLVSTDYVEEGEALIEAPLLELFESDDYYSITSLSEMLDTMTSSIDMMVGVLAAIAAISLVVGGIGIMNIMLVSVTERTREIGIRKSLGAKQHHILLQFVIEAATTSAIGGVLGIIIGYALCGAATSVVSSVMGEDLTIVPTISAVIISFTISAMIGIVFGYLPAKKAAQLNPIEALRYD